tara:strand:- start:3240 stop:3623 length:384 start_codon:yes stop_codon:yes gene_type:complete
MSFSYTPGLRHAGCYIVSGYPNVTTGSLSASKLDILDWDNVTKEIVFMNTSASDLFVYFNFSSPSTSKFKVPAGGQHTFDVKTRRMYVSGSSAGLNYSVCASLTTIPKDRIIAEQTGKGITTTPDLS